jgi:hypothetical protein
MLSRCRNPRDTSYKYYGGRGLKVCERWSKFENFLADMGLKPVGTTLDRKNNELGYSKSNCRWATPVQQNNNRRRFKNASVYDGRTAKEWASIWGINHTSACKRIQKLRVL